VTPADRSRAVLAAVIGSPVRHSLSPAIHNAAFGYFGRNWLYFAAEVEASGLGRVMRAVRTLPFGGLSVTTPLKEAVIEHLDDVSDEAARLRSVNCVTVDNGRLTGSVTDGEGCVAALVGAGATVAGVRAVLLGAGATARAIASSLCRHGAEVTVVNRDRGRAEALCADVEAVAPGARIAPGELGAVRSAAILLNATTVGMNAPAGEPSIVDESLLSPGQIVFDAVYQPTVTPLLAAAGRAGATTVDGMWMLIHQAVLQQVTWFGRDDVDTEATASTMRRAAERELALRQR